MGVWFGLEGLQGIWWRHFSWQTVPCSCRGDGKRSVADSGQSCRRDVQFRDRRWPQASSTGNLGDRLKGRPVQVHVRTHWYTMAAAWRIRADFGRVKQTWTWILFVHGLDWVGLDCVGSDRMTVTPCPFLYHFDINRSKCALCSISNHHSTVDVVPYECWLTNV